MEDSVDQGDGAAGRGVTPGTDHAAVRRLESVARSRWGLAVVAAWSFAEAIVLPIVPDVILGLLVLVVPRRTVPLFLAAIVGSLAGTAVLWWLVTVDPDAVRSMLLGLPGIDPTMLAATATAVAGGDPGSIASLGFGAPLKVDTWAWTTGPATPLALTVGVILNRILRVGPFVLACAAIGLLAPGWIRRHDRLVLTAYALGWLAVYLVYWM